MKRPLAESSKFKDSDSDWRPFLNKESRVVLQTPLDLPESLLKQYDALYESTRTLNNIIFPDDRVSALGIFELAVDMEQEGFDLFSTDLFVQSIVVTEGELTGFRTRLRGYLFEGTISLEIPADRRYTRSDVRDAFKPRAQNLRSAVEVSRPSGSNSYVLEPTQDDKMKIAGINNNFHVNALDKLGVDPENAVYASGVRGRYIE